MAAKLVASAVAFWVSFPPPKCDLCLASLPGFGSFVDGKTLIGPWANMCPPCHRDRGVGLGEGKGQRYDRQPDGRWAKMEPKATKAATSKKPPSMRTLEKWSDDGVAKAVDGCTVEPDGTCPHGSPSWLVKMGLM